MTPETLAAILHRAGVGTWHNSTGPHHETHLEEARALLREPELAALDVARLREAMVAVLDTTTRSRILPYINSIATEYAALQAEPARAEEGEGT